jgi:hypothetical protein
MATVHINSDCNAVVAHLPGVRAALKAKAEEGKARASAILAAHHHGPPPHSYITVTHGRVDSFVNLVDPGGAAAAIEFGRFTGGRGTTRGVGAITGAF